jgi:hypothetical protein
MRQQNNAIVYPLPPLPFFDRFQRGELPPPLLGSQLQFFETLFPFFSGNWHEVVDFGGESTQEQADVVREVCHLLPRLTNSISMTLVAEGVDTEESFQRLQQMGVARFQGYLFSEPLNIAALVELVGGKRLTIPLPAA